MFSAINFFAVLVSAIVFMILGMAYYGLGAKVWLQLLGKTEADLKQGNMGVTYAGAFVNALVINAIIAAFIGATGTTGAMGGAMIGFWAWLGFVATTHLSNVLWAKGSFKLYLFENGYNLIAFILGGAIIGGWM